MGFAAFRNLHSRCLSHSPNEADCAKIRLRYRYGEPIVVPATGTYAKRRQNTKGTRPELVRLAGAEHKPRTTYVVDVLWRDVRRNKQREALKLSAGAWNTADHPELAQGGAAHVEQIR